MNHKPKTKQNEQTYKHTETLKDKNTIRKKNRPQIKIKIKIIGEKVFT